MKPFVVNRLGRLVFPSNFFPELDFGVFDTLEQFEAVIERDFETKAPTGSDIWKRVQSGAYRARLDLMRDLALNLLWVNRYAITMYVKRPTRWRDVPRTRDDVFLPSVTAWREGERKVAAVQAAYPVLAPGGNGEREDEFSPPVLGVFPPRRPPGGGLPAPPTPPRE